MIYNIKDFNPITLNNAKFSYNSLNPLRVNSNIVDVVDVLKRNNFIDVSGVDDSFIAKYDDKYIIVIDSNIGGNFYTYRAYIVSGQVSDIVKFIKFYTTDDFDDLCANFAPTDVPMDFVLGIKCIM